MKIMTIKYPYKLCLFQSKHKFVVYLWIPVKLFILRGNMYRLVFHSLFYHKNNGTIVFTMIIITTVHNIICTSIKLVWHLPNSDWNAWEQLLNGPFCKIILSKSVINKVFLQFWIQLSKRCYRAVELTGDLAVPLPSLMLLQMAFEGRWHFTFYLIHASTFLL